MMMFIELADGNVIDNVVSLSQTGKLGTADVVIANGFGITIEHRIIALNDILNISTYEYVNHVSNPMIGYR